MLSMTLLQGSHDDRGGAAEPADGGHTQPASLGKAVQIDPIEPTLQAPEPWT